MKLKDYRPRHPMREVEYFGVKISIPADHEWVAMHRYGEIFSFRDVPEYVKKVHGWGCDECDNSSLLIGAVEPVSTADAANSLRYYPVGEWNE